MLCAVQSLWRVKSKTDRTSLPGPFCYARPPKAGILTLTVKRNQL